MPRYTAQVIETRQYAVEYVIEADTPEEALEKAEAGDTLAETELKLQGVTARYLETDDVEVEA